ncbi:MAG: 4Fe-4S dicluster domain-containing protein [Thermoleophilia bacterium]|nr:4Fe-4S dicluster domain-containing protein [Thermoleophilia bacterium]
MATRVNPKLIDDLERYGAQDVSKCYHCGNCSAVCPFSQGTRIFPRRSMRHLQLGLEKRLEGDLEPWLCYYCGECSEDCPREAEPGETMMSLRRWLTSRYDFTGISRLFYLSWKAELGAILLVALLAAIGFLLLGFLHGNIGVYDGPGAFLPSHIVHWFDWSMAVVLVILLGINCARMWWFTLGREGRDAGFHVPLREYLTRAYLLPFHFATQARYARCERKRPWVVHLALMLSYVTMLVLIMFFLGFMQAGPGIDWRVHAFGYAAALGLVVTTAYAMWGRAKRTEMRYKHSHESDWIFLILLFVVAGTGVLQHILHRADLDVAANVVYVMHLMGVVPMLVLEVPFGKWAHMAYRPLAMYFADLQPRAVPSRSRAETARRAAAS